MALVGRGVRLSALSLLTALALSIAPAVTGTAAASANDARSGEHGSGAPAFPTDLPTYGQRTRGAARFRWSDLADPYAWARQAANWVGMTNDWMRDFAPDVDGRYPFRPDLLVRRKHFARFLVLALAPAEEPDPGIVFPDLDASSRFNRFANVAVKMRWLQRGAGGRFRPDDVVTTTLLHRAFVRALGLRSTAREIDGLRSSDGEAFRTPENLGSLMLGLRLGLRHNNKINEWQDVGPRTPLDRAQVAYSLFKATTLPEWVVPYLQDQYAGIELPRMSPSRRRIVDWGLRYAGYPYVWGGEWGLEKPEPSALGGQPIPGFDCSGITWWVTRANDGADWKVAPPRPYRGWSLPQRTSRDMATMAPRRLKFDELRPGDLMFYDGDDDKVVDHVDVFVGRGWAIDSSSSVGGVTLMWVGTGWYRDHFKWGRRILPSRTG